MLDRIGAQHVYIACGYTDMRSGIDRLAALVKTAFRMNPYTNSLYLNCWKRADRIKALYWDADGFVLLASGAGAVSMAAQSGTSAGTYASAASPAAGGTKDGSPKAHRPVTGIEDI